MTADETAILRCPITRQSLRLANAEETFRVRQDIAEKAFVHPDGSPAKERFSGFLCVADTEILYPVIDNIFILLSDFAIVPQAARERFAAFLTPQATRNVMTFYDDLGWQKTGRGVFHDADINEDFRVVSRDYIHKCHLRVNDYLPRRGKYLLDVASGPIQYDDYMTYSANFERRICCDISLAALRAAAAKLGNKGIYIQGDITKLPLQDGVADGFVSLHTIYHVTAERQLAAFGELERVTRPGGCGVVVYSWGRHAWSVKLGAPARALSRLRSRARTLLRPLIPDRLCAVDQEEIRSRCHRAAIRRKVCGVTAFLSCLSVPLVCNETGRDQAMASARVAERQRAVSQVVRPGQYHWPLGARCALRFRKPVSEHFGPDRRLSDVRVR